MRHKAGAILAAAVLAVVAFGLTAKAFGSRDSEEELEKTPVILNDTITNDMSEFEYLTALDDSVMTYLRYWGIKGASLAIMRGDSLVYARGYGWADLSAGQRMQPKTLLRLASVSKLITATGIMVLCERGDISLTSPVFGDNGILKQYNKYISDKRYYDITVKDLLKHEAGFSAKVRDPLFSPTDQIKIHSLSAPPTGEQIIRFELEKPLAFDPGSEAQYSNLGFLLLVRVIETVSGEPYEKWTQDNVLLPCGCLDFHLAGNYYKDKLPDESAYYPYRGDKSADCFDGSGRKVSRPYGGNDIPTLSGAGAWMASVPELARFVASIDTLGNVKDIISKQSVEQMTPPTDSLTFGLGWNDTQEGIWTRTGTYSGTSALIKYYPDGECWIMVTNTSSYRGARFTKNTAELFEKSRAEFSALLPDRDLFYY